MREQILERGEDPSDFPILNSQPDLFPDLLWIWEGFMVLSTCRQYGMSAPQPIPLSEILAYCEYHQIDDVDERDEFLYHVQKLDLVLQADFRAKNPPSPGRSGPGRGGPPPRLGGGRR
jgi:hypothetical protein